MSRARAVAVAESMSNEERRTLRRCFAAAVLAHTALMLLPVPGSGVEAAAEPPVRVVHRLVNVRRPPVPPPQPPERPPEPPPVRPPVATVPVPEVLADEPVEAFAQLPVPEVETPATVPLFLPDGPPPPPPAAPDDEAPVYVVGAVQPPVAELSPPPAYPEPARRAGRTGIVILQATIDREGEVTDLQVLRGAPFGLTESALSAVSRWRFRPATLEGRPVAVYYQLTVRFETR